MLLQTTSPFLHDELVAIFLASRTVREPSVSIKVGHQTAEPPQYFRSPSPPTTPSFSKAVELRRRNTPGSPSSTTSSPVIHTSCRCAPESPTPVRIKAPLKQKEAANPPVSLPPMKSDTSLEDFEKALNSTTVKGFAKDRTLKDHQRVARSFMARCEMGRFKGGMLLGDVSRWQMGLGKTVQLVCRIADSKVYQKETGVTCIVSPCGIMDQWKEDIKKFAPSLRMLLHRGSRCTKDPKAFKSYDVVIASYKTLWSEWTRQGSVPSALMRFGFLRVVLDEGHNIAKMDIQTAKACRALEATYRWVVTGTPIREGHRDLISYYLFLRIITEEEVSFFDSDHFFTASFKTPFTLGRKKGDYLNGKPIITDEEEADFVNGIEIVEPVKGNNKYLHLRYYKDGEDGPKNGFTWMTRQQQVTCIPDLILTSVELKPSDDLKRCQICDAALPDKSKTAFCDSCKEGTHPENGETEEPFDPQARPCCSKITALLELLEKLHANDAHAKIVVYCLWPSGFDIIHSYLVDAGYIFVRYDGKTSQTQRLNVLRSLKTNARITIALVSLRTGGFGLNLNFCNYAIMFNPWWSPAVEDQAFDRLHRIGQDRDVKFYKFIMPDTIEKQNKRRRVQELMWKTGGPIDGTQSTAMDPTVEKRLETWKGKRSS
ncbi:hypothetical protein M407DRAFT_25286 [Tulasnella calospora MUT 4182]|uniref:Helicase C-terminal domain-containing protein n=1 Tax=Tulasnella calospora MUT 4182 TaxID=1051891 RepID=A0A0C3QGF4_9AGAM|nr:hypothetical protein M407DRAFT_25286 [Tulasnella calospora MUT 4182]